MKKKIDSEILYVKKFRFMFEAEFPYGKLEPVFVRPVRPKVSERVLPPWNTESYNPADLENRWIPGFNDKQMALTIPDVNTETGKNLFEILAHQYQFAGEKWQAETDRNPEEFAEGIVGTGVLGIYSPSGDLLEHWILKGMWFHYINFGDLCYSTNEDMDIELGIRYNDAEYQFLGDKEDVPELH